MSEDKFIMPERQELTIIENTSGKTGRLPENFKIINDSESVAIPLYNISEPIDWRIKHISDKRWKIVSRMLFQCEAEHIRRQISKDGFRL